MQVHALMPPFRPHRIVVCPDQPSMTRYGLVSRKEVVRVIGESDSLLARTQEALLASDYQNDEDDVQQRIWPTITRRTCLTGH